MRKEHLLRDLAVTAIAVYFCGQSFYIVIRMWSTLSFNDKVSAMETVIFTTFVLCEALDILHFYKFDDMKSALYTGELFKMERRIELKNGERAMFRGKRLIRDAMEKRMRIEKNGRKFVEKHMIKNSDENIRKENCNLQKLETRLSASKNVINNSNKRDTFENNFKYSSSSIVDDVISGNNNKHMTFIDGEILTGSSTSPFQSSYKNNQINSSTEDLHDRNKQIPNPYGSQDDSLYERKLDIEFIGDKKNFKEFFDMKRSSIIEEMLNYNMKHVGIGLTLLQGISGGFLLVPLYGYISFMAGLIEFQDIKLSFLVYIPFTGSSSPANIEQFIAVTVVQTLYIYLFYALLSDSFMIEALSSATLKTEINLFLNNLEEFDSMFCADNWSKMDDLPTRLRNLKILEEFGHIVAHHQMIYRKLATFQQTVEINVTYINGAVCTGLSISLYLLQGEFYFKVKYTVGVICIGLALAVYSQEGQDIEDGFEKMRDALYRMSWHNMPVNLKKYLVILLTKHNDPPKITGSYGMFIINRKNLSMIMQASYSYLNLLNQIK